MLKYRVTTKVAVGNAQSVIKDGPCVYHNRNTHHVLWPESPKTHSSVRSAKIIHKFSTTGLNYKFKSVQHTVRLFSYPHSS